MRSAPGLIAAFCLVALLPAPPLAANDSSAIIIEYENDLFAGDDRWYTNGVRLTWVMPSPSRVHRRLLSVGKTAGLLPSDARIVQGFAIGQSLYTPANITVRDPPDDQRPYAGWLYLGAGIGTIDATSVNRFLLTAGVVGPAALGEPVQRSIHRLMGSDLPRGWHTQLRNEPTLMVSLERVWRLLALETAGGWGLDLSGHGGAALGTPFTLVGTGLTLRVGHHMPRDFSPPRIQPAFPGSLLFAPRRRWGWYLFAGVDGQARAHDTFIDGNLFRTSGSVERNVFVGEFMFGAAIANQRVRITQTYTTRSREFPGQSTSQGYGSISITWLW